MLITETEKSILQALAYFDMFQYPLRADEIHRFMNLRVSFTVLQTCLHQLVAKESVYKTGDFYSLQNNLLLAENRKAANIRAEEILPLAHRIGRFIGKFPFVKGIGISGSLSKNCADKETDIDFFIITEANRLWIARTFLHVLKKMSFLAGKQHWLCMNYFLDESSTALSETNLFIATELVTLKPVTGNAIPAFLSANRWAMEYFPNYRLSYMQFKKEKKSILQNCIEPIFRNKAGDAIDTFLMNITRNRWVRKMQQKKKNRKGGLMGLTAGKHYCKPEPENFQYRLLRLLEKKFLEIEIRYNTENAISCAAK